MQFSDENFIKLCQYKVIEVDNDLKNLRAFSVQEIFVVKIIFVHNALKLYFYVVFDLLKIFLKSALFSILQKQNHQFYKKI